jgi:hypothetical protein
MVMLSLNKKIQDFSLELLLEECAIKIFIDISLKKVYFYQSVTIKPFKELPSSFIDTLINKLLNDPTSLRKLKKLPEEEILEKFTFQLFSTLYNLTPD